MARSNPAIWIGLDPMARPSHWPKPVTQLTTIAHMREWFTHVCNNNWLIILERKEGNLPVLVIKLVYQVKCIEVSSMNNHLHYKYYEFSSTMNLVVL
jgi:hypothetical protein